MFWLGVRHLNLFISSKTRDLHLAQCGICALDPRAEPLCRLNPSNDLCRGHECDRQTMLRKMRRNKKNPLLCKNVPFHPIMPENWRVLNAGPLADIAKDAGQELIKERYRVYCERI